MSNTDILLPMARKSLFTFQSLVHKTNTGAPAIPPKHLQEIVIPVIENDSLGHTVIVAPPESAKTLTLIGAAGWWLGNDPSQHIAYISETRGQAVKRSVAIRDTIEFNDVFKKIFPDCIPNPAKGWSEDEWFLVRDNIGDKDASLNATGVVGRILGNRFDRVILDDIASRDNMATALQREKVIDWLQRTLMTRVTPTGRIIMIATRWAEEDPVAWALEQGWYSVHIPALNEQNQSYWPEQWPLSRLACENDNHESIDGMYCWEILDKNGKPLNRGKCRKREVGSQSFIQQYLGKVFDDSSSLIKREYWNFYTDDELEELKKNDALRAGGIFVDTAHTTKTSGDYSVIGVIMTTGAKYFVIYLSKFKAEFPELKRRIIATRQQYNLPIYIEDTPGSKALIQSLQSEALLDRVSGWSHKGRDKRARVEVVLPMLEAGNVYLPKTARWRDDLIEECAAFPFSAHDDQVDVISMGLSTLSKRRMKLTAF